MGTRKTTGASQFGNSPVDNIISRRGTKDGRGGHVKKRREGLQGRAPGCEDETTYLLCRDERSKDCETGGEAGRAPC
jgi:hypothetical protein